MFCIPITDYHHSRRILHSFRSHKSLRAEAVAANEMHHHHRHHRQSSEARSSTDSARPSTSRTDVSIEWDPLRLHPVGPVPAPVLGDASRHHDLRQARLTHNLHQHHERHAGAHSHSHSQSEPSLVIYDGFDFGFQPSQQSAQSAPSSPTTSTSEGVTPRPHMPADFFKRGDWKRRGIVFSAVEPTMATEDECFDLDVDEM